MQLGVAPAESRRPDVAALARHAARSGAEAAGPGLPGVPQVWRQGLCPFLSGADRPQGPANDSLAALSQELQAGQLDPVDFFGQLRQQFGPQLQVDGLVVESRADVAQAILNATDGRDGSHQLFAKSPLQAHGLGLVYGQDSLVLSGGDSWQQRRALLQPHFRLDKIQAPESVAALRSLVGSHLDRLQEAAAAGPVDMNRFFREVTLDVATRHMFSEVLSPSELSASVELFDRAGQEVAQRQWFGRSDLSTRGELSCWAERRLQGRQAGEAGRDDLLQALLDDHAGGAAPLEEVATMAMLGHETTANWLSWAVHDLHSQPAAREQIRAERDSENPAAARITLREAVRNHTPNFLLGREALTDVEIDTAQGQVFLPKGTQVLLPLQQVNADVYNGEEQRGTRFYSFGGGSRVCLGQVLARQEAQIVLAELTSRFDLTPVTGHSDQATSDISSRPAHNLYHVVSRTPQS